MAIEIVDFHKYDKGSLKGFLTIQMTTIGLEIRDLTLHQKDGKRWVNLPSKPYEKDDGTTGYSHIVYFPDENRYHQFQKATLKVLDEHLKTEVAPEINDNDIPF